MDWLLSRRKQKKTVVPDIPRLPYPHVDLYHWAPANGNVNFGDHLSQVLVGQILAQHQLSRDDQVADQARLLAIGSVLHYARTGDHIWGTGWNGKIPEKDFTAESLQVHAVRGPLTREFLQARGIQVPEIYGDPALLVPYLFKDRFRATSTTDYVVVPNLHDLALCLDQPNLVSPLWGWNRVVEQILSAKLVLASSLHGLIIAEAYGIPARYLRLSETENLFKYKDYYLGSGRTAADFVFATSVEEGLAMGGAPAIQYDPKPLLQAFPFSLWY
jgi:pyruvyltransferase